MRKCHQGKSDVFHTFYGALGQEDLVLIMGSDSVLEMVLCVEKLRQRTYNVNGEAYPYVDFSFSFIESNGVDAEQVQPLDVECQISVTLNAKAYSSQYLNALRQACYENIGTLGKYDLLIRLPKSSDVFKKLFSKDGLLNLHSSYNGTAVNKLVLQSKTSMLYPLTEYVETSPAQPPRIAPPLLPKCSTGESPFAEELSKRLHKLIKTSPYFKQSVALAQTLWILYSDYLKCENMPHAAEWIPDLQAQFKTLFICLEKPQVDTASSFYDALERVISAFRQTFTHIHQAARLFFDMPQVNLRYSGSYNKVVRAYYGLIKHMLEIGYACPLESGCKQSRVIPMVVIEHTPTVRTEILFDTEEDDRARLVIFKLPYAALTEIPMYARYLCHEIFHLICPSNRKARNKAMGNFWLASIIAFATYSWFHQLLEKASFLDDTLARRIAKKVSVQFDSKFKEVLATERNDLARWYGKAFPIFVKHLFAEPGGPSLLAGNITEKLISVFCNKEILKDVGDKLTAQYKNVSNEQQGMSFLLKELGSLCQDEPKEKAKKQIKQIITGFVEKDGWVNMVYGTMHGLREAYSDMAMITLSGMCDTENEPLFFRYIASLCVNLYENNDSDTPQTLTFKLRIGSILHKQYGNCLKKQNLDQPEEIRAYLEKTFAKAKDLFVATIRRKIADGDTGKLEKFAREKIDDIIGAYISSRERLVQFLEDAPKLLAESYPLHDGTSPSDALQILRSVCGYYDFDNNSGFTLNIETIEALQDQESFEYLCCERPPQVAEATISIAAVPASLRPSSYVEYYVSDLNEYIMAVRRSSAILSDSPTSRHASTSRALAPLWYRGHTNRAFTLLPTLLRSYVQSPDAYQNLPPFERQLAALNLFKMRGVTALEMNITELKTSIDWLVNLQHYGGKTSLLDWSENAMVGLYFALVPFKQPGVKMEESRTTDAAVYLLNPIRMNTARAALQKNASVAHPKTHYPLINLSDPWFFKEYDGFALESIRDRSEERRKWREDPLAFEVPPEFWPIATVVPTINRRVRAQFGTFVAFNLRSRGLKTPTDMGDLSLEEMHRVYKEKYPMGEDFLVKIMIRRDCIAEMASYLLRLGYSDMHLYPELERVVDTHEKQIEDYFT